MKYSSLSGCWSACKFVALLPSGTAPKYSIRCLTDLLFLLLPPAELVPDECDKDDDGGTEMGSYSESVGDNMADDDNEEGGSDLGGLGGGSEGG